MASNRWARKLPSEKGHLPNDRPWLPRNGTVVATSWFTMQRFPELAPMFCEWPLVPIETSGLKAQAFAGWGRKLPARMTRRLASVLGRPFLTIEDGFFRSVGLGKDKCPSVSFVVDDLGIHYDAATPSRLEMILAQENLAPLHADAEACRALIVRQRLTKYNHLPDSPVALGGRRGKRILLVDQVFGDHSVAGALAGASSFQAMLAAARAIPQACIILRTHPDVSGGRARGMFGSAGQLPGVVMCDAHVSPHAVLDAVDEVWTVSSQLGFDALLRNIPVRCFGAAFYAGWGLTQDTPLTAEAGAALNRRRQARNGRAALTIPDLVAAALLRYCLYYDPVRRCPADIEQSLARLVAWREHAIAWRGTTFASGISRHKRASLKTYCGPAGGQIRFGSPKATASRHLVWGTKGEAAAGRSSPGSPALIRAEDGFLRSVGLGSQKHVPLSLCFDKSGMYYDATRPSDLEEILQNREFSPEELARAGRLRQAIVASGASKYNLAGGRSVEALAGAEGKHKIVVFGQVPDDESIRLGLCQDQTNLDFLASVRKSRPEAFLAFKEHPDLAAGKRAGRTDLARAASLADAVVTSGDAIEWIALADEVHVRTSLAGFEALLRGKRVVCHGVPFYSGWGLTIDKIAIPRRNRHLSVDELVAACLIVYPVYVHPVAKVPMQAEDALFWITEHKSISPAS